MFRKFFLGAAAFVAAAGIVVGSTRSAALPPYSFDGAPATPAAYSAADMDIQVHSRNGQSVSPIPASGFSAGHKASYSVPVPEGATSAQIGLTSNYGGPCIAEGFNL